MQNRWFWVKVTTLLCALDLVLITGSLLLAMMFAANALAAVMVAMLCCYFMFYITGLCICAMSVFLHGSHNAPELEAWLLSALDDAFLEPLEEAN